MLGDEEIIKGNKMLHTCKCYSTSAEILFISKRDFQTRVRGDDSINYLNNKIKLKAKARSRLIGTQGNLHDLKPENKSDYLLTVRKKMISPVSCISPNILTKIHYTSKSMPKTKAKLKPISNRSFESLKKKSILDPSVLKSPPESPVSKTFDKSITPR